MIRRLVLAMCVMAGFAAVASAQTGVITSVQIQFLQNGAILPAQVMTITLPSGAVCGQTRVATPPSVYINTTGRMVWVDPANAALDCIAVQNPGGILLSLPLGANYTATATFTNDFGNTSPVSAASNSFTRGPAPAPSAPTGVRVLP